MADRVAAVKVKRAYRFRADPTRPQEGRAVRLLAGHCDLDNAALMERREAWRTRRASISYGVQSAQLTEIRRADPDCHGPGGRGGQGAPAPGPGRDRDGAAAQAGAPPLEG